MIYPDSSLIASMYCPDANTGVTLNLLARTTGILATSVLGEFETLNAFHLRLFRREIPAQQAASSLQCLEDDLAAGVLQSYALSEGVFARARHLSGEYTAIFGTRAADLLHLAAALELGAKTLYSFDRRQRDVARAAGLKLNALRRESRRQLQRRGIPRTSPRRAQLR